MKKLVVCALLAFCGLGTMAAQQRGGQHREGGRPRMSVEEQVNNLKKELKLTDDQTKKVTALYTDFQKKMEKSEQGSREQMRAEREKLNKQVETLLTDDQKKTFRTMQANRRGGGPRRQ